MRRSSLFIFFEGKTINHVKRLSASAIDKLVSGFSDKTLPKQEWTHQAHIIVALWHNKHHDFDTALALVKEKIKTYNLAVGTLNTEDSGYHESLTIFWMMLTRKYLLEHPDFSLEELVDHFLRSEYASKDYPFQFYSRETLFSKKARKGWQNGDLKRFPLLSAGLKHEPHFAFSDEQFEAAFRQCTLPPATFSHEAHLRLAWIFLRKKGLQKGIKSICNQITNYVNHLGAQDKYHHTLTVAAVHIVHHFMQASDIDNFGDFILASPRLKADFKGLIQAHYSFDIFQSKQAKEEYMEPDVLPFVIL